MVDASSDTQAEQGREREKGFDAEGLGRTGAIVIAVAYGIGLLTTNIYLHSLGISDFSILKPKTVLTGAVVLGTLAAIAFGPLQYAARVADRHSLRCQRFSEILMLLLPFILVLGVTSLVCPSVGVAYYVRPSGFEFLDEFPSQHPLRDWAVRSLLPAAQLYVSAALAGIMAVTAARFYRRAAPKQSFSGMSNRWTQFLLAATASVLCFAWYSYAFSASFYAEIPQQFGGGRPEIIHIEVEKDAKPHLKDLGIAFVCDTNITEPLRLIHESETSVAVLYTYHYGLRMTASPPSMQIHTGKAVTQLDKKVIMASTLSSGSFAGALSEWHHCTEPTKPVLEQEHTK